MWQIKNCHQAQQKAPLSTSPLQLEEFFTRLPKEQTHVRHSAGEQIITGSKAGRKGTF